MPKNAKGLMMVSAQQPPGELSAMIDNMTDDWVSSDEEFAPGESKQGGLPPGLTYNQWHAKTKGQFTSDNYGTANAARRAKIKAWKRYSAAAGAPDNGMPKNAKGLMMVSAQQPPGELSAMIDNMTDDWVSSDEELNFAEQSENDSMEFAASSSLDTDSDLDFAQSSERSVQANSSEEESHSKTSSGMEFAESSAAETDSDLEFAESSDKTSSGLEFAESSAVESD